MSRANSFSVWDPDTRYPLRRLLDFLPESITVRLRVTERRKFRRPTTYHALYPTRRVAQRFVLRDSTEAATPEAMPWYRVPN